MQEAFNGNMAIQSCLLTKFRQGQTALPLSPHLKTDFNWGSSINHNLNDKKKTFNFYFFVLTCTAYLYAQSSHVACLF